MWNRPRVLLAAPASGSGKTMITCGILQALVLRGLNVASFKCGPDYIDPMFHEKVIGARSGFCGLIRICCRARAGAQYTTFPAVRSLCLFIRVLDPGPLVEDLLTRVREPEPESIADRSAV